MSHLHSQLHRFSLLPIQCHSAHRRLQLRHRDARLVHVAEVLRLETNHNVDFFFHIDYSKLETTRC